MPNSWQLLESYLRSHPAEAAGVLESLSDSDAAALLAACPPAAAAAVLPRMQPERGAAVLATCDDPRGAALLEALEGREAERLLRRLEAGRREALLGSLPEPLAKVLRRGLDFPPDTAGGLMDPRALSLPADLAVKDARRRIRRNARFAFDPVFVTDREQRVKGAVPLRAALLSPAQTMLVDLAASPAPVVSSAAGHAAVLAHPAWSRHASLAVVDDAGRFLGAIAAESLSAIRVGGAGGRSAGPVAAGLAIGELYWITASRLFGALVGAPVEEER